MAMIKRKVSVEFVFDRSADQALAPRLPGTGARASGTHNAKEE